MVNDPVLLNDWHPVTTLDQLQRTPVIGLRLLGEAIVVWLSPEGPRVWQDLCVHRGTQLSLGSLSDGRLACAYHGWQYGASGQCEHIPAHPDQAPPAKAIVKSHLCHVQHGIVFASLGEPKAPPAWFAEWDDAGVRKVPCGPYTVNASAPRVVENFLDVAHFPFVHEGYLGVKARPEISDYEAVISDEGVIASGVRVFQPNGYGDGKAAEVEYTYKALRPLTAYFKKEAPTQQLSIVLYVAPNDLVHSTAWMIMAENYMGESPVADLVAFQDKIFSQDAPILQSQRPELLPLDLQAELHLKSDRTAIAYRKWLKGLGMLLGT
jgi:phenylpropionate dioxygenase-like ring-hydroxylating dioxygenase large terminal subunit